MSGEVGKSQKEIVGRGPLSEGAGHTRESIFRRCESEGRIPSDSDLAHLDAEGESRGEEQNKKRPQLFSPGRLGISSPPPELPNHEMDIKSPPILCKRHLGNLVSAELSLD